MPSKLLAAILLCASSLVSAGTNTWTAIGPTGGSISHVVFGSSGSTVFATTSSGFYRSQDSGSTWHASKTDFMNGPTGMAIDPSDASRVYVVAQDWPSLYMSTDGGATLAPVTTLPTAVTQARQVVVSQDGSTIFVNSGARVFRSTDRGLTWSERAPISGDSFASITCLAIDPSNPNRVYAAGALSSGNYGLLRTQDGGQSWQVLLSGASMAVTDIAISTSNPLQLWAATLTGLFRSTDQGANWTNVLPGNSVGAVAMSPASPAVVYAGLSDGQVFRTSDSGANWTNVTGGRDAGSIRTMAVNPAQGSQVLLGGNAGLYGSSNSGVTWSAQQTGILGSSISDISMDTSTARIYINTAVGGIYYTTPASVSTAPVDNNALKQLLQASPQTLFVTKMLAQPGRLLASLAVGLARSLDGGNTWSMVPVAPTGTQQIFGLSSSVGTPQTVLAAGDTRLFRSTDGGVLWTQITAGIPANTRFGTFIVAPSDGRVAYTNLYQSIAPYAVFGIHRSVDAGLTWSPASANPANDPGLLAVDPVVATTLYASTQTALLKSIDGGATWSPLNWVQSEWRGGIQALAVDPLRTQTLYAASSTRVARSVDGGTTWETLRDTLELPSWSTHILFSDPTSSGNLYAATGQSGVQKFTIAPDLVLSGTSPAVPTGLGVPLVFSFQFGNQGPFDATGAKVNVQWPGTATNVSVTASSGTCVVTANSAVCTVGTFRMASTATLTVTATPAAAGAFEVSASFAGDQSDANPANNAVALQTNVAARADLSVTAAGTATAQTGGSVTHTVTVRNAGPNSAAAPTLTFQLGSGLAPVSASTSQGSCSVNATTTLVTCTLADLASGNSAVVTVSSNASVAGSWGSTAQVGSATADGSTTDNTSTVSIVVTQAVPAGGGNSGGGGGGGGGGGAISLWENFALLLVAVWLRLRAMRQSDLRDLTRRLAAPPEFP